MAVRSDPSNAPYIAQQVAAALAAGTLVRCPECGDPKLPGGALSAHRALAHGVKGQDRRNGKGKEKAT